MTELNIGDLIRWRNPLYIVEDGRTVGIDSAWHHALILSLTQRKFAFNSQGHTVDLELLLMGRSGATRFNLSLEFLYDLGEIQRLLEGEWSPVPRRD